jgi:hypothetical protein
MAPRKRDPQITERAAPCLDRSAVDTWRNMCPVRPEHKDVFPADAWLWQPAAAAWVWGVLKAGGGNMQAEQLTQHLAQIRGLARRQAGGLRNRGLTVLEAFRLIEVERLPTVRGSHATSIYGNVSIVRDRIDEREARRRRKQAMVAAWNEMLRQAFTPTEEQ